MTERSDIDALDAAANEGMLERETIDEVAGLDLDCEQFVDATFSYPRDKLVAAVDELKGHQLYIIAARETVNEWHKYPDKITPVYLAVVEDIVATAERILGISYQSNRCSDESVTEVSSSESD